MNTRTTRKVLTTDEDPFMGCFMRRLRAPQSKNTKKCNNNNNKKEKTLFDNNIDAKDLFKIKEGINKWYALHLRNHTSRWANAIEIMIKPMVT